MLYVTIAQRVILIAAGLILLLWAITENGAYNPRPSVELATFVLAIVSFVVAAGPRKAKP